MLIKNKLIFFLHNQNNLAVKEDTSFTADSISQTPQLRRCLGTNVGSTAVLQLLKLIGAMLG